MVRSKGCGKAESRSPDLSNTQAPVFGPGDLRVLEGRQDARTAALTHPHKASGQRPEAEGIREGVAVVGAATLPVGRRGGDRAADRAGREDRR
jgi:hypothetical protein